VVHVLPGTSGSRSEKTEEKRATTNYVDSCEVPLWDLGQE
jgi:hypothetical protein